MKNMCLELINNYLKDYNEFKSTLSNLNINAISIDIRIEEFKKLYNKLCELENFKIEVLNKLNFSIIYMKKGVRDNDSDFFLKEGYLLGYGASDLDFFKVVNKEIMELKQYYKKILEEWEDINYMFYSLFINEPEMMKIVDNSIYLRNRKRNNYFHYKNNITIVNFSKFIDIENLQEEGRLKRVIKNKLPDNKVKSLSDIYLNSLKNKIYKTNVKLVFLQIEELLNRGFLLLDLNIDNYEEIFKEEITKRYLYNIAILGYRNIVLVSAYNYSLEFKINIDDIEEINVKLISMENLIRETRSKLYNERVEETEEYKLLLESIDLRKKLFNVNIKKEGTKHRIIHKNLNDLNEFYKNSLFILKNVDWNEFISKFRKNKINISTGMNNKKGVLNTLELKLVQILKVLFKKEEIYDRVLKSFEEIYPYFYKDKDNNKLYNFEEMELPDKLEIIELNLYSQTFHTKVPEKKYKNNKNQNKRYYSTSSLNKANISIPNNDNKTVLINTSFNDIYFREIEKILKNRDLNSFNKQYQLETFWNDREYLINTDIKNINKNLYSKVLKYIIKAKQTLDLKFKNKTLIKKFPKLYLKLNNIIVLIITLGVTLSLFSRKAPKWTNTSKLVGEKILNYLYIEEIKKILAHQHSFDKENLNKDKFYQDISNYSFEKFLETLDIKDFNLTSIILGDFFLEIFCSEPHTVLEKEINYDNIDINDSVGYTIKINNSIYDEIINNLIVYPASIPMLCKPLEWNNSNRGGYLLDASNSNIITGSNNHGHKIKNIEILYNTINSLNSMEFRINIDLLKFLQSNEGKLLIEEIIDNNKAVSQSEKLQFYTNYKLAQVLEEEEYYLPLKADFRGRLYVTPFYLNYQGSDFSRSLIYFKKGEKLTRKGFRYLLIYGANLYNANSINKENYEDRLNWVRDNLENIYNMNINFIKKAENVWLFTAFCLIMKNIKQNSNYEVHFPIFIDATCSGIQHVAAMIKDFNIAKNVNLIKQNKKDKVQDIYTLLLEYINKAIEIEGLSPSSQYPLFEHVKLTRTDVKLPVLTKTYSVTLMGMKNQLMYSLKKRPDMIFYDNENKEVTKFSSIKIKSHINKEVIELDYKYLFKLAQIIEESVFINFPYLKLVYDYFKNMCKILNLLGLPVIWTTPTGIEISQKYLKKNINKVAIHFSGKTKKLVLKEWKNEIDKRAQINAIIPNIVHSLDASHLMEVIKNCNQNNIVNILPIHDCFGMHPNNLEKVYNIIKLEFVNIYSKKNFMEQFHEFTLLYIKNQGFKIEIIDKKAYVQIKNHIKLIPSVPDSGDFDLKEILTSLYMFN